LGRDITLLSLNMDLYKQQHYYRNAKKMVKNYIGTKERERKREGERERREREREREMERRLGEKIYKFLHFLNSITKKRVSSSSLYLYPYISTPLKLPPLLNKPKKKTRNMQFTQKCLRDYTLYTPNIKKRKKRKKRKSKP
jgi:hypothetical protein